MAICFGQNKFFEYYIRVNDIVGQNYEKSKKSRLNEKRYNIIWSKRLINNVLNLTYCLEIPKETKLIMVTAQRSILKITNVRFNTHKELIVMTTYGYEIGRAHV